MTSVRLCVAISTVGHWKLAYISLIFWTEWYRSTSFYGSALLNKNVLTRHIIRIVRPSNVFHPTCLSPRYSRNTTQCDPSFYNIRSLSTTKHHERWKGSSLILDFQSAVYRRAHKHKLSILSKNLGRKLVLFCCWKKKRRMNKTCIFVSVSKLQSACFVAETGS